MYYRLTTALNDVGSFINVEDNPYNYISQDKDAYLSVYAYNEDQKKQAEETIEVEESGKKYTRKRGVAGIKDVLTPKLVFDTDHKTDLNVARKDMMTIVERLLMHGFNLENINLSFSGGKGFSAVVYHNKLMTPEQHKAIALKIAGDLQTFDSTVYNASRIFRLDYTKHNSSGLFKTPISYNQLSKLQIETIKEQASNKKKPTYSPTYVEFPTLLFTEKTEVKKEKKKSTISTNLDFTKKPSFLSDVKFALHKGYIPPGYGNEGMMVLCATYKNAGLDKKDAYHALKSVNEKRSEIYGCDKRDTNEIWHQVVEYVYGPLWKGGTYSPKESELLQEIQETFGIVEKNNVVDISQVGDRYLNFAQNINQNVIKTGIKSLDDNLLITTGMMVGMLGAPSSGKCLGKGTLVRMFDGSLRKVEEIKVGEYLMGDDSLPRKVLSICSGRETLFRVNQENGNSYIVNESHILSLKNNANFSDKVKHKGFSQKVIDIPVKDYLNKSKYWKKYYKGYKVGVEYPEKQLVFDPYIIGVWLGDGTSSKSEITTPDKEILSYLNQKLCTELGLIAKTYRELSICYIKNENRKTKEINPFLNALRHYNIFNNKHIPKDFLINSRYNRLQLLAGLLDTDGYLDKKKNSYELTFKSTELAENTVELIRSLGFRATINKKMAKYKSFTKGRLYQGEVEVNRIYIAGRNLHEIPCKVLRKKASDYCSERDTLLTQIKLENLGEGEYYGFEIDGNKRFLLSDYTVTHNTSFASTFIENLIDKNQIAIFQSLDMHDNLLFQRLVQRQSGIDMSKKLRKMIKDDEEFDPAYNIRQDQEVIDGIEKVKAVYKNVDFNFNRGCTVETIEEDIKRGKQKHGNQLKLVVVDYLEKVRGPYSDATANSGFVASRLSDLCSTYDVAILLLLQPQKSAGDPSEELLSMRNVKGASIIEQDCRVILTLWRPGFNPKNNTDDKYATIAIVKNNMGELHTIDYGFNGLKGKFTELSSAERAHLSSLRDAIKQEKEAEGDSW